MNTIDQVRAGGLILGAMGLVSGVLIGISLGAGVRANLQRKINALRQEVRRG